MRERDGREKQRLANRNTERDGREIEAEERGTKRQKEIERE